MNEKTGRNPLYQIALSICLGFFIISCLSKQEPFSSAGETWGIYQQDLDKGDIRLIFGGSGEIIGLSLDPTGTQLVFSQMVGGEDNLYSEIFLYSLMDKTTARLTENNHWDLYPVWSPDGTETAFLSWRDATLDIYLMDKDGANQRLLYDSGYHDADIDWVGSRIVFTQQSRIWIMDSDGSNAEPVTDPPRTGEWGQANLPFGDYDPRLSPDGSKVVFSRMIGDESIHGNYDIFRVNIDGSDLINLTGTGYSQGLSNWSPLGDELLYIVAAVEEQGVYDLYTMNRDGSEKTLRTPDIIPPHFLIHWACYSTDPGFVYLVGQWWIEDS